MGVFKEILVVDMRSASYPTPRNMCLSTVQYALLLELGLRDFRVFR